MTLLQSRVNNVDVVFQCIALKMQINCWNFVPLATGLWILIYCYFSAFKQKSKQSLIVPLAISVPNDDDVADYCLAFGVENQRHRSD